MRTKTEMSESLPQENPSYASGTAKAIDFTSDMLIVKKGESGESIDKKYIEDNLK